MKHWAMIAALLAISGGVQATQVMNCKYHLGSFNQEKPGATVIDSGNKYQIVVPELGIDLTSPILRNGMDEKHHVPKAYADDGQYYFVRMTKGQLSVYSVADNQSSITFACEGYRPQ